MPQLHLNHAKGASMTVEQPIPQLYGTINFGHAMPPGHRTACASSPARISQRHNSVSSISSTQPGRRPRSSDDAKRDAAKNSANRSKKFGALQAHQVRPTPPPSTPRRQACVARPPTPVTPVPTQRLGEPSRGSGAAQPSTPAGPSTPTNPNVVPLRGLITPSSTNALAAGEADSPEGTRRTPVILRTYRYNRTIRREKTSVCSVPSVLSDNSSLPSVLGALLGSRVSDKDVRDKLIQVFIANGICQMCQCISWNLSSLQCGHSFCTTCLSTAFKAELQSNLEPLRYGYHYGHSITHCSRAPTNAIQFSRTLSAIERHGIRPEEVFSYRCWICRHAVKTVPVPNYTIRGILSELYQVIRRDLDDLGYSRIAEDCGQRAFDFLFVNGV
ncbi:hypothetical protein CC1G_09757 [Coprinopsis cinerea okayama7|uniref:RING-type domain-containing protein n=1 Tax=Coprinopsis cinerea (strain Okayama-7 / 130 / ATCC MYA-4618 / FGSC 9003) TaxID=240176 RepID=A8PE17_COPC7|nr:hypothetical protein CC1G_09757 [Coprinopsis cinerea okayama7\|eukprot:XP_001840706.2 hypothetical protein CC1G_09757 [Coprinopsis cinerea okayama7\